MAKRGVQRALGVILECLRSSEGRHHRIPGELLDGSSGRLDLRAHCVVEPLESRAGPLGVLFTRGSRRVDEICEQDRGELALGVVRHGPSLAQNRP